MTDEELTKLKAEAFDFIFSYCEIGIVKTRDKHYKLAFTNTKVFLDDDKLEMMKKVLYGEEVNKNEQL